jgi:hypothetical protein
MRVFDYFSPNAPQSDLPLAKVAALEHRMVVKRLNRVLSFIGLTIDDVVNSRIAKNQVLGYYKLSKWVDRGSEIVELERQWNPNG